MFTGRYIDDLVFTWRAVYGLLEYANLPPKQRHVSIIQLQEFGTVIIKAGPVWIQPFSFVPHTNSHFLSFQDGENAIFTAETVAQRNGPIFAKQALNTLKPSFAT